MEFIDWHFWSHKGHRPEDCGDDGPDADAFGDPPDVPDPDPDPDE